MHTNASTARVHRRDTRQPISAANPATIHHGHVGQQVLQRIQRVLHGHVGDGRRHSSERARDPRQRIVHGSFDVDRPRRREVLLAQDLATDEDRNGHERECHDRGGEPRDLSSVHMDRGGPASLPVAGAPCRRRPVEHDRQRHDGEAARERQSHVQVVEAVEHDLTQTADPHGRRDHHDPERHHDRLVDP